MNKQEKKLVLKKETVSVLKDRQLGEVIGGRTTALSCGGGCESIDCPTDCC